MTVEEMEKKIRYLTERVETLEQKLFNLNAKGITRGTVNVPISQKASDLTTTLAYMSGDDTSVGGFINLYDASGNVRATMNGNGQFAVLNADGSQSTQLAPNSGSIGGHDIITSNNLGSFISPWLTGYATQSWVTSQGYMTTGSIPWQSCPYKGQATNWTSCPKYFV